MFPSNGSSSPSIGLSSSPISSSRQSETKEEGNLISIVVSPTSTNTVVASVSQGAKFNETDVNESRVQPKQSGEICETTDKKEAKYTPLPSCDHHHRSVITESTGENYDRDAECCSQTTASTETFSSTDTRKRHRRPRNTSSPIGVANKALHKQSPKTGHANTEEPEFVDDENCRQEKKRTRLSPSVDSPTNNRPEECNTTENLSNLVSISSRSPRSQVPSNQNNHRRYNRRSKLPPVGAESQNETQRGIADEVQLGSSTNSKFINVGVQNLVNVITKGYVPNLSGKGNVPNLSGTEVDGFAFCTNEISRLQNDVLQSSAATPQHVKGQKRSDNGQSDPYQNQQQQRQPYYDIDRRVLLHTQRQDEDFKSIDSQSTTWLHDSQDFYSPRLESTSVGVGVDVIPFDPYKNTESTKGLWHSSSCEDATKASINAVKDALERWRSSLQRDQASKDKKEWHIVHIQLGVPSGSTNPNHLVKKDSMLNVDIGRVLLQVLAMPVSAQPKNENGHQLLLQALQDARPTPTIEVSLGGMYTTHPYKTKHNSRSTTTSTTTIAVVACMTIEEVRDSPDIPNAVEECHYTPRFPSQIQPRQPQRPVNEEESFINGLVDGQNETTRKMLESFSTSLPRSFYPDVSSDVRTDNGSLTSSNDITSVSYPQLNDDVLRLFTVLVAQSQLSQTNQDVSPAVKSFGDEPQSTQDSNDPQIQLQDFLTLITQNQNVPPKTGQRATSSSNWESSTRQRFENDININGDTFQRPASLSLHSSVVRQSENVAIVNTKNTTSTGLNAMNRLISPTKEYQQPSNTKKISHGFSSATADVGDRSIGRSKDPNSEYHPTPENKLCPLTHLASISSKIHDQQKQDEEKREFSTVASSKLRCSDSQALADEDDFESEERPRRSSTGSLVDNDASENSDALNDDDSRLSPEIGNASTSVASKQKSPGGKVTKLARIKPIPHPYSDFSKELPDEESRYSIENGGQKPASAFPMKLHETLDIIETDGYADIIGWLPHGRSFKIHKQKEFSEIILPRYFVMTKKSSFLRQLNLYGFNRISTGTRQKKSKNTVGDQNSYYHERFLRGLPHLCFKMRRLKVNGNGIRSAGNPDAEPEFALYPKCPPDGKHNNGVKVATAILGTLGVSHHHDSRFHNGSHFTKPGSSPTLSSSTLLQSREEYLPQLRHESNTTEISDDHSNYNEATKHQQLVQLASHSAATNSFDSNAGTPSMMGTKSIMESDAARLTSHNLFLLAAQLFHHSNNHNRRHGDNEPTDSSANKDTPPVKSTADNKTITATSFGTDNRHLENSSPASTLNAASVETSQQIDMRTGSTQIQAEIIVVSSTSSSFPWKLQRILDKLEADGTTDVISWLPHGRAFRVHSVDRFVNELMPQYFNQTKYSSFQRQLHMYNFQRITSKNNRDKGSYHHPNFLRGQPDKALKMQRTRVNGKGTRQPGNPETEPDFYRQVPVASITVGTKIDIPLFNDESAV